MTAGKLPTRKQPQPLPVYDRLIRCALGRTRPFWLLLHTALRDDNGALHRRLCGLRNAAGLCRP